MFKEILHQVMKDLKDSPVYKYKVLIILLAMLDTNHILKLEFVTTETGRWERSSIIDIHNVDNIYRRYPRKDKCRADLHAGRHRIVYSFTFLCT